MGLVNCRANNQEDVNFARKHGIWQTSVFPKGLQIGDHLALQLTGTKDPIVVGIITSEVHQSAPYGWPSRKKGGLWEDKGDEKLKTITFDPLNFAGQWTSKKF